MIRRIYIDNYKCLVDFECKFENINLLLGTNGSGKSTAFEAIRDIRDFAIGKSPVGIFNEKTLTRWQKRNVQTFEIEVEGNGGSYIYRLEVEHEIGQDKQRVRLESLTCEGDFEYRVEGGTAQLFENGSSAGEIPWASSTQSYLPFFGGSWDVTNRTAWFKNWIRETLICLQVDPRRMSPMSAAAEPNLDRAAGNFVAWYRHFVSANMRVSSSFFESLKEMFDNFQGLSLEREGGTVQHLFAGLGIEEEEAKSVLVKYSFGELSDGERTLIVLYALLYLMDDPDVTLCLDEPDNYLALAEIQPWLLNLKDKIEEHSSQALLVSHHPELINYLAPEHALIFEREKNGTATVKPFRDDYEECLTPAEIVARGWE